MENKTETKTQKTIKSRFYSVSGHEEALDKERKDIRFISEKEFKSYVDKNDIEYVLRGQTKLKEIGEDDVPESNERLVVKGAEQDKFYEIRKKFKGAKVVGYIPVSEKEFIELVDVNPVVIILPVVCAVMIAAVAVLLVTVLNKPQSKRTSGVGYDPNATVTEQDIAEQETYEDGYNPSVSVALPGWMELRVAADETEITEGIRFFNPSVNEGYYDLKFELSVDVDGDGELETLYESGLVPAGYMVSNITLSEPIPEGEYDAVVFIQPYPVGETETGLNNGKATVKLYAEKKAETESE